ncbi:hypothetical protein BJ165DRAFT_1011179 [Panaeolus papilionaceus]|nr:hypothetical protein BJ165DRAFT_1011179 [Panaeolus papilionaceus]
MNFSELEGLEVTGDISIEPVTGRIPRDPFPYLYLIMGPTGAGKSSFIEALAGESQQLSISKDQLAGRQVYLLDTPGFSDSKISEVEIMDMVRKWMNDSGFTFIDRILYLTPISETRLPGSRRRTIEMLKQLLAANGDLPAVMFVTTMWDTLHNECTRTRAESNFAQLRDQICKDFFGRNEVSITRFMNTRNSALEMLDGFLHIPADAFSEPISSVFPNLYQDLHQRIEGALQAKQMIDSELAQPEAHCNTDLRAILEQNQRENHETLSKFISQLIDFKPLPFGYHRAAQHLRKEIAAQLTPEDPQRAEIFQQWVQEPEILEEPVPEPEPSFSAAHCFPEHPDFPGDPEYLEISQLWAQERDIPAEEPHPAPEHSSSTQGKLALNGLLRRLLNAAKHRGSKWFKSRA